MAESIGIGWRLAPEYAQTLMTGSTKDEARKELREIEAEIEHRTFVHEKKTPFGVCGLEIGLETNSEGMKEGAGNDTYTPCFHYWRPHGDSNPGRRRERPVS